MKPVKLKNGTEEADTAVGTVMLRLKRMTADMQGWAELYDLTMICRDSSYQITDPKPLQERALLELDGRVHESIRNIVLSAVTGDGVDMQLDSPIANDIE